MVHIELTGYGPFTSTAEDKTPVIHDVNASWEAVKEVEKAWSHHIELRYCNIIPLYPVYIPDTSQLHPSYIPVTSQLHSGYIPVTSQLHPSYILVTS